MLASLAGPSIPSPGRFGHSDADGPETCLGERALPGISQALQTVFAKQRMEAEPHLALAARRVIVCGLDPDEALVGQRLEPGHEIDVEIAVGIGDRGRHGRRPAAGEDREPGEEPALLVGQQLVAPVEGTAQRALAFRVSRGPDPRSRLRPSRSRIEAGLSRRTRAAASSIANGRPSRRRQISRMAASDSPVGSEVRPLRSRAVDEQGDGPFAVEGRDGVPAFAGDPQEFAAGHQRPQAGSRPDQTSHDPGRRREQLFEVVQDEEHRPLAQVGAQGLARRPVGCFPDVEGDRDGRLQEVRVAKRREVDEPDAVRESSRDAPATARASRVLPLPPGPAKVTIRLARRSSRTRSISSFRPTKVVTSPGRFDGTSVVRSRRAIVGRARDDQPVERDADPRSP